MRTTLLAAVVCGVLLCNSAAWAYRPYDSTDADALQKGEIEIELGLRDADFETDRERAFAAVFNFGIGHEREFIIESGWRRFESPSTGTQSSIDGLALLIKQIHRRGTLQGETGLSVASECGVLIPTVAEDSGPGGECTLIASRSYPALNVHAHAGLAFETDHRWANSLGLIVEAPESWRVKPGMELLREETEGERAEVSMLIGATWNAAEGMAFDLAYRRGLEPSGEPSEWRIGMTWSH